jgi:hypothetical protein
MTNGISPDLNDAALVQWATRQLGLDETASETAVRAAVRARLAQDDFLPALRRQQAVQLLCRADRPKVLPPLALDDEEQRLREEIDEFVQRFFQLGSAERRRQWRALQRQCQLFPPLAARLGALEAGLDAPGTDALPVEPEARELAEQLQSLFTARPAVRPGLRRSLLKKLEPEMDRWMAAAWDFRAKYPPLVALDARFLEQLANWKQRKKQQARGRRQRIPVPVESSSTGGGSTGWGGGQYAWLVIVIVVGLLRLLASGGGSNRTTQPPTFQSTRGAADPRKMDGPPLDGLFLQSDVLRELEKKRPVDLEDADELRSAVQAGGSGRLTVEEWRFLLLVVKTPALLKDEVRRGLYANIREKLQPRKEVPLRRDPDFPP